MNTMPSATFQSHSAFAPRFYMVLLLITNRCNLTCKHCYVSSHLGGAFGLSIARCLQLVADVCETIGRVQFVVSGGEPLSRRDDCIRLLEKASVRHDTWLLTNATLISKATARRLSGLEMRTRVSLDGGDASHHDAIRGVGAFSRWHRGIENLLDGGFDPSRIEVYATIPPGGLDQVGPILAIADQFGLGPVKFETLARDGRANEFWPTVDLRNTDPETAKYRQFFEQDFQNQFGGAWRLVDLEPYDTGFGVLNIYSDGDVYPYTRTSSADMESGRLGNINDAGLRDLLDPERVGRAVLSKFLRLARGPARSLHAYLAVPRSK